MWLITVEEWRGPTLKQAANDAKIAERRELMTYCWDGDLRAGILRLRVHADAYNKHYKDSAFDLRVLFVFPLDMMPPEVIAAADWRMVDDLPVTAAEFEHCGQLVAA